MTTIATCRVCLSTDMQMLSLIDSPMRKIYERLTDINLSTAKGKPLIVCALCHHQLRRCINLTRRALRSEELLTEYLQDVEENTKLLDHQPLLSLTPVVKIDIPPQSIETDTNGQKQSEYSIKVEKNIIYETKCATNFDNGHFSDENEDCMVPNLKQEDSNDDQEYEPSLPIVNLDENPLDDAAVTSDSDEDNIPLKAFSKEKPVVRRRKKRHRGQHSFVSKAINTESDEDTKPLKSIEKSRKIRRCKDTPLEFTKTIILTKDEQLAAMNERMQSKNYLLCPLKCDLCYKGFEKRISYNNHMEKHSECSGPYECGLCKLRYASPRQLRCHMMTSHERRYQCNTCGGGTHTLHQARDHEMWHAGHVYRCALCGQEFRKRTSYLTHTRTRHPSTHVCVACGECFVGTHGLKMHTAKAHGRLPKDNITEPESKRFCADCNTLFMSSEAWLRHIKTSGKHNLCNIKSIKCNICDLTFKNSMALKVHIKEHKFILKKEAVEPPPKQISLNCDQCGLSFVTAVSLRAHVNRMHLGIKYNKNIVCEICGKKCTSNATYMYHQRTHTGEKPYQCDLCPKKFSTKNQLRIHVRIHTGERPYCCTICGKRFSQRPALTRHYRIHSGAKPYICQYCPKNFSQSNTLKLHIKKVHLKLPFDGKKKQNATES